MSSQVKSLLAVLGVSALALTSCAADTGENGENEEPADAADTAGQEGEADDAGNGVDGEADDEAGDAAAGEAAQTECQFAPQDGEVTATEDQDSLAYWADELDIRIGNVAAGGGHHEDEDYPDPFPGDEQYREHLAAEYTSLTHENYLKWEFIHPDGWGDFHFEEADAVVELAQAGGMDMRGHALFWHSQNPEWLEEGVENGEFSEDELRDMLEEHVRTVVSRYAGCIQQCDLVNEIFDDCDSYTVWGTLDEHSWVPGTFEGEGDATLHEGDYERKPSYCILQRTLVEEAEGEGAFDEDSAFEECAGILSDYGV